MDPLIAAQLSTEDQTPFHQRMLNDSKALISLSRRKMNEFYPTWDKHDDIYRAIRTKDSADLAANERKEPEKMTVPITYSQIQTFVAFCMSLFTQRDRLYELVGFTPEDEQPAKVGESLLARDLAYNAYKTKLSQFFLDIARFGMGVIKVRWATEMQRVKEEVVLPSPSFFGKILGRTQTQTVEKDAVKYQGNVLMNISPYRFFPDVRLPFVRFQEGEFCASEDVYSYSQLKQWEKEGEVAGVDHIKQVTQDVWQTRGFRWNDWMSDSVHQPYAAVRGDGQMKKLVIVTEIQRKIIPTQYLVEGEPLGPEDYPVMYVIWLANDNRVIKAEPMNYLHGQFTYVMAPFTYDNNNLLGLGLSDIIYYLQDVMSWFINARITSVRKTIDNKFLVNPKYINFSDVENRRPFIRLLESAPGDLDRYLKQLNVIDVTQHHIEDVRYLHELVQVVTGINDSLLGQFQTGRRPAAEHRNVATGSAARLKIVCDVINDCGFKPMGEQMLSNLRDGLEEETYIRILGQMAEENPAFIKVSKDDLVGHYAFEMFDTTLPSERRQQAQTLLEELLTPMLQNPQVGALFGFDVRKLMLYILKLQGIKNPEQFAIAPQPQILQPPPSNGQPNPTANGTALNTNGRATAPGLPGIVPEPVASGNNGES